MADLIPVPRDHTAVMLVVFACGHIRIVNRKLFGRHFHDAYADMDGFLHWPNGPAIRFTCPVHRRAGGVTDLIEWRS